MSKAFVIDPNPTVRWPVTVRIPVEGGFEEWRFTGIFKVLPEEDFEAWDDLPEGADRRLSEVPADNAQSDVPKGTDRKLSEVLADNARKFAGVLVGWDEVTDPAGRPVTFTAALLEEQVCGPRGLALSAGINKALQQIRFGLSPDQPGAALGNSVAPPAAG